MGNLNERTDEHMGKSTLTKRQVKPKNSSEGNNLPLFFSIL